MPSRGSGDPLGSLSHARSWTPRAADEHGLFWRAGTGLRAAPVGVRGALDHFGGELGGREDRGEGVGGQRRHAEQQPGRGLSGVLGRGLHGRQRCGNRRRYGPAARRPDDAGSGAWRRRWAAYAPCTVTFHPSLISPTSSACRCWARCRGWGHAGLPSRSPLVSAARCTILGRRAPRRHSRITGRLHSVRDAVAKPTSDAPRARRSVTLEAKMSLHKPMCAARHRPYLAAAAAKRASLRISEDELSEEVLVIRS
jgi:hypothetical protein